MNAKQRLSKFLIVIIALGFMIGNFGAAMPVQADASALESAWSHSGWFSIVWGDSQDGKTNTRYALTDENGGTTILVVDEALAQSVGGVLALDRQYVTLQGVALSPLANGTPSAKVSAIAVERSPRAVQNSPKAVTGSRPWISIMCKFSDVADEPKNLAYFQNMYASTYPGLDHYWREVSFDIANVVGSGAAGWFTLPHPVSYYNPTATQGGADLDLLAADCTAAADASVNFSLYQNGGINMMFNFNFDYGYAWGGGHYMTLDGIAQVWSMTWEPPWGYESITVMSHEMGHGFGLPHSSGTYGQTYDNRWDIMSDGWTDCGNSTHATYGCLGQHTISYHKDKLGWIAANKKYTPAGGTATITLEQLALPQTGNYLMAQLPIGGSSIHFYTVEVRRKVGYDIKLPGEAVIIHEVDTTRERPANVIDSDGNGNTGDAGAMWTVGETFTDAANGITVSVVSATSTGFEVSITAPAAAQPDLVIDSISVTPTNPAPNQLATYTVRVRNQGSASASTSFWVDLFVDGAPTENCSDTGAKYWSVASLNAGAYQDLTTTMALSAGSHSLYAFADTNCFIAESIETNNVTGPVNVTIAPPKATFRSVGAYDGYIWESTETSGIGLNLRSADTTFQLGDDNRDRQYRAILSFNTASLPNNAVITKVTLKIRQSGAPVGSNPFAILGALRADIRKPYFGTSAILVASDFQAAANRSAIGTFGATPVNSWYSAVLNSTAYPFINLMGTTQFRLRFVKDDNDDMSADYMRFISGNHATVSARPTLIVEYYVP